MSLRIKVEGGGAFLQMQIAGQQLDKAVQDEVRKLAREGRQAAVAAIRGAKSGRKYGAQSSRSYYRRVRQEVTVFGGKQAKVTRNVRQTKATKAYTASAPGEAPAVLTGTLLRAIRTKFPRSQKGYGAKVFAYRGTAYYRHFLEFGTSSGLAKRPLWSPIQERLEAQLESRLLTAVDRFVREF
ncbi:hypothetical protein [Pseudoroseomonas cervicalis]|uniref:hypothetical protein n=1 Tax=Teichococcus cervicalis TaxID=204525 RepID=UPI002788AC98|nr:hypothetical protein [Pseudoroseomonas cervicalis]MDQ1078006.1 hypothetical protein [Pseudoroseomonas cervicalis]